MDKISEREELTESFECENGDKKRKTRNQNEKKRRDQFNNLVNELMTLVCHGNKRKMDKSLVLQTTINLLKNHKDVKTHSQATDHFKPAFLSNAEFCQIMLEAVDGFIITVNRQGEIMYVSENVLAVLGHEPSSMINKQIFSFVPLSEHLEVDTHLQTSKSFSPEEEFLRSDNHIEFHCHLLRSSFENVEDETYEHCKMSGGFKQFDKPPTGESNECLIAIVHPTTPIFYKNVSIVDKSNNEFVARLSLEWKFLLLDHKASSIIGYLPFEVLGTCSYDYNHFDDLEDLTECHRKLMQYGAITSGFYRFLSKGQQWIWLKTHYYTTYNQWNSKPEFIVCTNTAVSYSDVVASRKLLAAGCNKNGFKSDIDSTSEVTSSVAKVKVSERSDIAMKINCSFLCDSPENKF